MSAQQQLSIEHAGADLARARRSCDRGSIDHNPLTACALYPGGPFQDDVGRTSSRPSINVCPIGTWHVTAVNRSPERDGTTKYQDQIGQIQCKNVSKCPAGTQAAALHSVSSDTQSMRRVTTASAAKARSKTKKNPKCLQASQALLRRMKSAGVQRHRRCCLRAVPRMRGVRGG